MAFSITSSPEQPLRAFRDKSGQIVLALSNMKSLSVTITVAGQSYVKTFIQSELSTSLTLDISRYVRDFTFTDIYVNNLQVKSYSGMSVDYTVSMTATYLNDTTETLSLTGKAIASC